MEEGGDLREGKLMEEVGRPRGRRGKGSGTRWKGVSWGAVRFMFDIDAGSTLGFELEVGFENLKLSLTEKRAMGR